MARVYEQLYKRYLSTMDRKQYYGQWHRRLRFILAPHLPSEHDARIVDVGAGGGECIKTLQMMGYHNVEGVDISEEQIAVAKANGVTVQNADGIAYLRDHPDTYDSIISFDFLEHLSKDEIHSFLSIAAQALRPGGKLIVRVPNSVLFGGYSYSDFTHRSSFSALSITQVMRLSGFGNVCVRNYPPEPVTLTGTVRYLLWGMIYCCSALYFLIMTGSLFGGVYTLNLLAIASKELPVQRDSWNANLNNTHRS